MAQPKTKEDFNKISINGTIKDPVISKCFKGFIESLPALFCRIVPQKISDEAVRNFVGDDGKNQYGDAENKIYALHITISYVSIKNNLYEDLPDLRKRNDNGRQEKPFARKIQSDIKNKTLPQFAMGDFFQTARLKICASCIKKGHHIQPSFAQKLLKKKGIHLEQFFSKGKKKSIGRHE